MPRYKRSAEVAQLDVPVEPEMAPEAAQTLKDLRNMWEFASLMQYIFLFGNVVKIDEDFDIEVRDRNRDPRHMNAGELASVEVKLTQASHRTSSTNASSLTLQRSLRKLALLFSRLSRRIAASRESNICLSTTHQN
jgi:hypothetical protein